MSVAVVTGGSAGLGRAIVRELADRGWDVAILARGVDGIEGAAADVRARGRRALAVSTDVTDRHAVEAAADSVERELGPIDLWVNNAMAGVFGGFLDVDPDDFERATMVDYFGFVNGTRAALSRMTARDRGHVIQVGSALAHRGIPLQSAYCGAKHAIKGFTDSVVVELLHNKSAVTISTVDMPALNTIQFNWVKNGLPDHPQPVPPIFEPEVGAIAVADVADRPRRHTWVGEMTAVTIIGNRLSSRAVDLYLARTGFDGQQAPEKTEPMWSSNLHEVVGGDHGARGIFSDAAKSGSPATWAIAHRGIVATVAGALGVAAASAVIGLIKRR
ncbi:MAG: SDR family oxidoreductase [Microbacteriaceae bacterium]